MERLEEQKIAWYAQIASATSLDQLEEIRVSLLGKKGDITELMKSLGTLSLDEKRERGPIFNAVRDAVQAALQNRKNSLEDAALSKQLMSEREDLTLPGAHEAVGSVHPIFQTMQEAISIFGKMGFVVKDGPNIEDDHHNFTALNIPSHHPARQDIDTFYLKSRDAKGDRHVLRTHTSPVQIRTMMQEKPPLRILSLGRVYRADYDMTHTPMFHQIEGLVVEPGITMAHLKGCLLGFLKEYFGRDDIVIRLRPSYFPFTEPSAEVDIGYSLRDGKLELGGNERWLEILGCGMIHQNVFQSCGYKEDEHHGFAFGMGVERITMLKHGIPDLRTFFEGDQRWHQHYGFSPFDAVSYLNGLRGGYGR